MWILKSKTKNRHPKKHTHLTAYSKSPRIPVCVCLCNGETCELGIETAPTYTRWVIISERWKGREEERVGRTDAGTSVCRSIRSFVRSEGVSLEEEDKEEGVT